MSDQTDIDGLRRQLALTIHAHWKLFLAQGVVMMVLGFLAVAVPILATLAVEIFVGWLFFVAGLFRAVWVWRSRQTPGFAGVLRHRGYCFDRRRDRAPAAFAKLGLGAVQRHRRFAARLFDLGRLAEFGELGDWPPGRHQHALPRIVPGDDRARGASDGQSVILPYTESSKEEREGNPDLIQLERLWLV
jgi:hypothetical protein